jgi:glucose/arabinose dehydrogenase
LRRRDLSTGGAFEYDRASTGRGITMGIARIFAGVVSLIGGSMIMLRGQQGHPQAAGAAPTIPAAQPQRIMSLKMPTALGWPAGRTPVAAPGLKVNAFARELDHPRCLHVLPNGDVLVAEALTLPGNPTGLLAYAVETTMMRAGALGPSANRITLLRDADGDGVAEIAEPLLTGLNQPFGMALVDGTLYVGNTDGLMAFPYELGATRITAPGKQLMTFKTGGHWTRNLIVGPDRTKLYVSVGSLSNIGDSGLEAEVGRACIYEYDLRTGASRIFASGLRNPVGLAFEPTTGKLFTVVNERDGLGDETPPDYLTSVQDGGFYGWPFSYWGRTVDTRVPQDAAMVARALQPDFALGGHTASLGLCWVPEGTLPGLPAGMAIGQHGSWNRSILSGYRMILVPFADGRPVGPARDLLTGFLTSDERGSYGRPVGTALAADNSLLLADDVGNVVWRVTAA